MNNLDYASDFLKYLIYNCSLNLLNKYWSCFNILSLSWLYVGWTWFILNKAKISNTFPRDYFKEVQNSISAVDNYTGHVEEEVRLDQWLVYFHCLWWCISVIIFSLSTFRISHLALYHGENASLPENSSFISLLLPLAISMSPLENHLRLIYLGAFRRAQKESMITYCS